MHYIWISELAATRLEAALVRPWLRKNICKYKGYVQRIFAAGCAAFLHNGQLLAPLFKELAAHLI